MGPGSFDPGNMKMHAPVLSAHFGLQWGRGLSTPEMAGLRGEVAALKRTSMGPGSFDPGNGCLQAACRKPRRALQWGRGLSTPEIAS